MVRYSQNGPNQAHGIPINQGKHLIRRYTIIICCQRLAKKESDTFEANFKIMKETGSLMHGVKSTNCDSIELKKEVMLGFR